MSRYLGVSGRWNGRFRQGSKLVLRKSKFWDGSGEKTSPVALHAGGVGPSVKLEDCGNDFVTDRLGTGDRLPGKLTVAAAAIKGCNRVVQRYQNLHKIYSRESHVYQCDFFRLMYFPPDHFLSLFRKSKPAVNVRTVGQVFLNGRVPNEDGGELFHRNSQKSGFLKTQDTHQRLGKLFESNPSNIPRNYAFIRRQLRVALRKSFIKEWHRLNGDLAVQEAASLKGAGTKYTDPDGRSKNGVAKDGYYMYQVLIFPDKLTQKEFDACVQESVQVVSKLDWDEFLKSKSLKNSTKTWVELANDRVRVDSLNKSLENDEAPFVVRKV